MRKEFERPKCIGEVYCQVSFQNQLSKFRSCMTVLGDFLPFHPLGWRADERVRRSVCQICGIGIRVSSAMPSRMR
jgi:hypothetical protein